MAPGAGKGPTGSCHAPKHLPVEAWSCQPLAAYPSLAFAGAGKVPHTCTQCPSIWRMHDSHHYHCTANTRRCLPPASPTALPRGNGTRIEMHPYQRSIVRLCSAASRLPRTTCTCHRVRELLPPVSYWPTNRPFLPSSYPPLVLGGYTNTVNT